MTNTKPALLAYHHVALLCASIGFGCAMHQHTMAQADLDKDGIEDKEEQLQLEKYLPYIIFDHDEPIFPTSAIWMVQHSILLDGSGKTTADMARLDSHPEAILEGPGTWTSNRPLSDLKLSTRDPYRTGQFKEDKQKLNDVPIYGHFVPITSSNKFSYAKSSVTFSSGYLAQYWMLFTYNDTHAFDKIPDTAKDLGDHEGDWVWIDVILDEQKKPTYVVYHHHGDSTIPPSVVPWDKVEKEKDAPKVFLEKGTHEAWETPGEGHGISGALRSAIGALIGEDDPSIIIEPHAGNGETWHPKKVWNLGEPGRPISQELDPKLALLFSGLWGSYAVGTKAHPVTCPPGPVNQFYPTVER